MAVDLPDKIRKAIDLSFSVGLSVGREGKVSRVMWDSPAFKAGLSPAMKVVAVNGKEYSSDVLKDAVTAAAKDKNQPVELLVKNFDEYSTLRIDYHDGLKYPYLERIEGKADRLSELLKAR